MFGVRSVMVPTDFSKASIQALACGKTFADRFDAALSIVHVVPLSIPTFYIVGLDVRRDVVSGMPHDAIVRYAEESGADLIVLTLQGRGFLHRSLLGTTAERVIRSAHLPVLSLPLDFVIRKQIRAGAE